MKVLLFSTQWPEYMIELANAIGRRCPTVLVLPLNHRFTSAHRGMISREVVLETYRVIFHKSVRENARMLLSILRIIRRHRPTILHIQANGHRLFHWIYLFLPRRTRVVNTIHDPVKHLGDKLSLSIDDGASVFWGKLFTSRYIVHGNYQRDLLAKEYGIDSRKIFVVPHGNFSIYRRFQRENARQETNVVLFFGRIWKYKGLDVFIEAAHAVIEAYPDAKFVIAGKGDDISRYIEKIRYPDHFEIVNERVPMDEAGLYFERCAIVVLPYLEASQSGVIPVAFSYGRPVIATDVGALPEVVRDGVSGFIVRAGSASAIADKILFLLRNPALRESMGKAALNYATEELSWDLIAAKTIDIYRILAS